jgi:hypothetical protein
MAKAIINKARRLLSSLGDAISDEDREETHDLLDEAEEASDDGQDVSKSVERITSKLTRAKEKAAAEANKGGKSGQPKPPGKTGSESTTENGDGKQESTHGGSRSWFGA